MTMDTNEVSGSMVGGAAVLNLRKDLFYDEANPSNPATLSGIFKMLFTGGILNALLPAPAAEFEMWPCPEKYQLWVSNVTSDDPSIILAPVMAGLALDVSIPNFSADFEITGPGDWQCLLIAGTKGKIVVTTVKAHVDISIFLGQDGKPVVSVGEPTTELEGLSIQGESIQGALLSLLVGLVQDLLASQIENMIKGMIQDQLSGALQQALQFLSEPLDIGFDLPIGAGIPVLIVLYPSMKVLEFTPDGGYIELDATIRSEKKIALEPRGAIRRDGCLWTESTGIYAPAKDAPIEAALYDDILNQALYSVWTNGALSFDLTPEDMAAMDLDLSKYGITNFSAQIRALLPPVLEGCGTGETRLLQAGDLYVHAIFDMLGKPVDLEVYLYVEAQAAISIVEEEGVKKIGVVVTVPFNTWFADVVAINEEWNGNESMFTDLLNSTAKTMIEDALTKSPLSFAVPAFALSSLGEGLPEDQGISLDIWSIVYNLGYTIIKGAPAIVPVQ